MQQSYFMASLQNTYCLFKTRNNDSETYTPDYAIFVTGICGSVVMEVWFF